MKSTANKQLDHLLQTWAERQTASSDKISALQEQIVQDLALAESSSSPLAEQFKFHGQSRWGFASLALAASALVILAAVTWQRTGKNDDTRTNLATVNPRTAEQGLRETSWPIFLDQQSRLLAEYQNVFDQEIAWISETEKRSDLGLQIGRPHASPDEPRRYFAIRLRLLARSAPDGDWKEARVIKLLVREEELVQIAEVSQGIGPLTIWAYPIDEEMVAIDLQFRPGADDDLQIEANNIQRLGRAVSAGTFQHKGVEYRLDQTADFVKVGDLG